MRPPEPLAKALTMLSRVMPKAKLVPQKDLAELAIRDLKKRKQVCSTYTLFLRKSEHVALDFIFFSNKNLFDRSSVTYKGNQKVAKQVVKFSNIDIKQIISISRNPLHLLQLLLQKLQSL